MIVDVNLIINLTLYLIALTLAEECSDFIDNRAELKRRMGSELLVKLTKHFIERFLQRKARDYKKIDLNLLENIAYNILRDGEYYATTNSIIVFHPTYTIISCFDGEYLVLKTIIKTSELEEKIRRLMRRARRIKWRNIIIMSPPMKRK